MVGLLNDFFSSTALKSTQRILKHNIIAAFKYYKYEYIWSEDNPEQTETVDLNISSKPRLKVYTFISITIVKIQCCADSNRANVQCNVHSLVSYIDWLLLNNYAVEKT